MEQAQLQLAEQRFDMPLLDVVHYLASKTDADDAPIIKFVNTIIEHALQQRASDIHFETYQSLYRIRFRQDGLLREIINPPIDLSKRITSRIKIMANLDISERRIPQDGAFALKLATQDDIDFRVSICPLYSGDEKVVIRILYPAKVQASLESLGLNPSQFQLLSQALSKPQGMILVTGPTGSGKSLTLYSALQVLNKKEVNILTVEDPVEIKVMGINQVSINPKVGLTFSSALRGFLRQDPDIIMLGEIRDFETADLAVKAAQTGHLLLSTLHTNSASEALNRLHNIGVADINIASSINLVIAQRLVRKLCVHCKSINRINPGCEQCSQGYKGRTGIFELLPVSGGLVQKQDMLTLYQAGLEKVEQGITTLEEINRVTL